MRSIVPLSLAASLAGVLAAACTSDEAAPAESSFSTDSVSSAGAPSNGPVDTSQAPVANTSGGTGGTGSEAFGSSSDAGPNDDSLGNTDPDDTAPDESTAAADTAPDDASDNTDPDTTTTQQTSPPFPDDTPTETTILAVPTVRQEHAVVALEGEIYVLGGFTPSATATVQAYSPATDTWRDVADFPVVFHHPNAGAIEGRLYVAGFLLGSSLSEGDGRVFAYDPEDDEWTPRSSMPAGTERGSACVTVLGSKLYVFGGASRTTVPDASAYDTESDTWQELPFMPELREHCVAATVDGLIYIVSGRAGSIAGVDATSFVYDPETNTYTDRAPIPTPRGGTAGALLYGRIFVFGGEGNDNDESGVFSEVEAYDPLTDTWQSFPSMTIPRHGFGAAALGNRIYLPGGGTKQGFGSVDDHTVFSFER